MAGFYDYSVFAPDGEEISMKQYEGKVVIIINRATG
jgi:glutathione peroxidase